MLRRIAGVAFFLGLQACAAVEKTPVYWGGTAGQEFCSKLEKEARDMSTTNASFAWMAAGAALGAVSAGGIVTGINVERKQPDLGIAGITLMAGGALLVPAAQALFSRADAASILAEAANLGLLKEDRDAYVHCATAKGQWVRSRADANNFAVIMLNDQAQKEQARKDADKQRPEAEQEKKRIAAEAMEAARKEVKAEEEKRQQEKEARERLEEEIRAKIAAEKKDEKKPAATPAPRRTP